MFRDQTTLKAAMTTVTLKGNVCHISGHLPDKGSASPQFTLVKNDLSEACLDHYQGRVVLLNIFPSIDTPVCSKSALKFNEAAASLVNTSVLNISTDLPFAQGRFCTAKNISSCETLSCFRSSFASDFGLQILDGPLKGLCARAVIILDENHTVLYTELVDEITHEPDYERALKVISSHAS